MGGRCGHGHSSPGHSALYSLRLPRAGVCQEAPEGRSACSTVLLYIAIQTGKHTHTDTQAQLLCTGEDGNIVTHMNEKAFRR